MEPSCDFLIDTNNCANKPSSDSISDARMHRCVIEKQLLFAAWIIHNSKRPLLLAIQLWIFFLLVRSEPRVLHCKTRYHQGVLLDTVENAREGKNLANGSYSVSEWSILLVIVERSGARD